MSHFRFRHRRAVIPAKRRNGCPVLRPVARRADPSCPVPSRLAAALALLGTRFSLLADVAGGTPRHKEETGHVGT